MKIIVGILSCQMEQERQRAVRATWARQYPDVSCLFLVGRPGRPPEVVGDILYLDCPDWYEDLPKKTRAFVRYALQHLPFDYLFKCDDDTYVDLAKLQAADLGGVDYAGFCYGPARWDRRYHFGKCYDKRREVETTEPFLGPWMCGGAGYWLSRKAAAIIAADPDGLLGSRLYEDKAVSDTLRPRIGRGEIIEADLSAYHVETPRWQWKVALDKLREGATSVHAVPPEAMRRIHAALGRANRDERPYCGVLTGADTGFFPGTQLLVRSLREHVEWPIAVVDQGLTDADRDWCREAGVQVLPEPPVMVPPWLRDPRERKLWFKPFFIQASPFTHTLWIDSDAVVIRHPGDAFVMAYDGFWVFRELHWPEDTPNFPALYRLCPTPVPPNPQAVLNGGVIFCSPQRDSAIIREWCGLVERAMADRRIARLIRWHDQGALIWALHKTRRLPSISDDTRWNALPNGLSRGQTHQRKAYPADDTLLACLREDHPDAVILHWMGWPKLTQLLIKGGRSDVGGTGDAEVPATEPLSALGEAPEAAGGAARGQA